MIVRQEVLSCFATFKQTWTLDKLKKTFYNFSVSLTISKKKKKKLKNFCRKFQEKNVCFSIFLEVK